MSWELERVAGREREELGGIEGSWKGERVVGS